MSYSIISGSGLANMERRFHSLESEMLQVKGQVVQLRKDLKMVEAKNEDLKKEVSSLKEENNGLWNEIYCLKGPRLLLDIIALIIEELRHDRPTLKICSLVCRDWLHLSRSQLFRSIYHSSVYWQSRVDYLAILRDPSCTIFPYVRIITIYGDTDDGSEIGITPREDWPDLFLVHVNKFTSLTTIVFIWLDWEVDKIRTLLAGVRHQITRIELHEVWFKSTQAFIAFISNFPTLDTLCLHEHSTERDNFPYPLDSHTQPPHTLRRLSISNNDGRLNPNYTYLATFLLRWLLEVQYTNLQAIQICVGSQDPNTFDALVRYVTFLGSSLVDFKIMYLADNHAAALATVIAASTDLRHVDIFSSYSKGYAVYNFPSHSIRLPTCWIPTISVLPPSVESIILEMDVDFQLSKGGQFVFDWSAVDKLLSGGRFPALKELIIWSARWGEASKFAKQIEQLWPQLLPLCAAKQILTSITTDHGDRPINTFS